MFFDPLARQFSHCWTTAKIRKLTGLNFEGRSCPYSRANVNANRNEGKRPSSYGLRRDSCLRLSLFCTFRFQFTADHDVVDLIRWAFPVSWDPTDLIASSEVEHYATKEAAGSCRKAQTFQDHISRLFVWGRCYQSPTSHSDLASRSRCHH